jgi:hypothetical protein
MLSATTKSMLVKFTVRWLPLFMENLRGSHEIRNLGDLGGLVGFACFRSSNLAAGWLHIRWAFAHLLERWKPAAYRN